MLKLEVVGDDAEKVRHWIKNHKCSIYDQGTIGGRISYSFTPTGLGPISKVICACGEELDLTNYEEW